VYSVSHDLRSPLINLQGFSEELKHSSRDLAGLFERDGVPPKVLEQGQKILKQNVAESVHFIQAAVDRLARIIDALLRLSRAGRVQYDWQILDVAALVGSVLDALHDSLREKDAEVVVNPLPEARGDSTAIEQALANLLGNAVKYLDPARPGRIEVGSLQAHPAAQSGFQVYYVKDNGLGIPEAYHARVFTAFNRLHAGVAPGEGIGLALVRRIVERHGGSIWVESAHGVGTTFFVTLPTVTPERTQTSGAQQLVTSEA
jgi:signal transduction histidine kinase